LTIWALTEALAAAELVRPPPHRVTRQPHPIHHLGHAVVEFGAVAGEAEVADRLRDDVAHPHARIEARERVLEHHLHAAAQGPQAASGEPVDALARQIDLARGRVGQAQDHAAQRGLAATALAHHRQGFALRHREGDAVDRVDHADAPAQEPAFQGEVLGQHVGFEQRRRGGHAARPGERAAAPPA